MRHTRTRIRHRRSALVLIPFILIGMGGHAFPQDQTPRPVPITLAGPVVDAFSTLASTPEGLAALEAHKLTVQGTPWGGTRMGLHGGARCEWEMSTPAPGQYVVVLHLNSGEERPGVFGYLTGDDEHASEEFRETGRYTALLKCFLITIPEGQARTRMSLTGSGVYFLRAAIAPLTDNPLVGADGSLTEVAQSGYRTSLRREGKPVCAVLVPDCEPERELATGLAAGLGLPTIAEPDLSAALPAWPVPDVRPDTNLVVVTGGRGGPLAQALRRAQLIDTDHAIPGPGGHVIRTIPRPFQGTGNVIVISASDEHGLGAAVETFAPITDEQTGDLFYDTFLMDVPGERWAELRNYRYRLGPEDEWFVTQRARLGEPLAGLKGSAVARSYVTRTADFGNWYWRTGEPLFAELFRDYMFKMQDENIYSAVGAKDSHMALFILMQAWDRVEEAPALTDADRLRIANYLLLDCLHGREGFARAYTAASTYAGEVRMRHNHQTILGCGLVRAWLYFSRMYDLDAAQQWKTLCDELISEATAWGHAPEDSPNYEPRTFIEVARMINDQGLTTRGVPGSEHWPEALMRFVASRDSFSLPACYGDCWDGREYRNLEFVELMGEEWGWAGAQAVMDRVITCFSDLNIHGEGGMDHWAYLRGSTDVGGLKASPDPAASARALQPLLGLVAVPMTEGFHAYLTGALGCRKLWEAIERPRPIPYELTADKVQYRSGFGLDDEYLLLDTIGQANHAHFDLGALVHYCAGGRLWVVDTGYTNSAIEHHSTLEVARDGQPAWGPLPQGLPYTGDFSSGPNLMEIVGVEPAEPGTPGAFSVTARAHDVAGAIWERTVSGGGGAPLTIEDTLTADEAGRYELVFRMRLLGKVAGREGEWLVGQQGATLPVSLEVAPTDTVAPAEWKPDAHTRYGGAYPYYPFIEGDGRPTTLEWKRAVHLQPGQATTLRARLGPPLVAR